MMKHEFEKLAGYEVSESDYNKIIEPMYNATDLDKSDFVKVIDRKRFEIKKEKTAEQIDLENRLNAEIGECKETIKWFESRVEHYENILTGEGDEEWIKDSIKNFKEQITLCKNRIKTLKWVLG